MPAAIFLYLWIALFLAHVDTISRRCQITAEAQFRVCIINWVGVHSVGKVSYALLKTFT